MEKQTKNHLKKNYLNYISGPILFTAPHSKKLLRGGKEYGEIQRTHLRQIFTSYFAVYLAQNTKVDTKNTNSFCIWGKSSVVDENDLDPNYLNKSNLLKSPFHQTLHKWAASHIKQDKVTPLLHVDIHGKFDRENNCEVDIGIRSMEVYWENQPLIDLIKQYFQVKFNPIFQGKTFGKFNCKFNTDPCLHGYWGGNVYTMNQQAISLNIPSFQLQIPSKVRHQLFKDEKFLKSFANGIYNLYKDIIVPYWPIFNAQRPLKINKKICSQLQQTIKTKKEVDQTLQQLKQMQQKQKLQMNAKMI